jgi:hypothetical protein
VTHRDYSHRSTVDKLGIKPGDAVALVPSPVAPDEMLVREVLERTGRDLTGSDEVVDVVLIGIDASSDVVSLLRTWRARIRPAGVIWLLTPKRGQPGYVNQTDLIPAGAEGGLVDNKTCSVSETVSGMRFVIRLVDR